MLAVLSANASQRAQLVRVLSVGELVFACGSWSRFERAAPASDCTIVWVDWLADSNAQRWLALLGSRRPSVPVVLVTSKDAENLRWLTHLHVDAVVWPGEIETRLCPIVRRAREESTLRRIAKRLRETSALHESLRRGLAEACVCEPPVLAVHDLAALVGCDRRTLSRYWHSAAGRHSALRLEDVLHWLLLLRAVARKDSKRAWSAIAAELGIHEHTLARLARKLVDASLASVAIEGTAALGLSFLALVLAPLPSCASPDAAGDDLLPR